MVQGSIPLQVNKFSQGKPYILNHNESRAPLEDIFFGAACVRSQVTERAGRMVNMNTYVGTLSGDLVSGDVVTLVGYTEAPDGTQDAFSISVTYATSHTATSSAIETAIEGAASDVAVTRSNSNRTFTMVASADKKIVITTPFTVTSGGAGTATFSETKSTSDTVRGFAEKASVPMELTLGTAAEPKFKKNQNQMMPVLYDGHIPVKCFGSPADGDPVYALLEDYTDQASVLNLRGTVRPDTDGGLAPVVLVSGAAFASSKSNGLALVAIKQA